MRRNLLKRVTALLLVLLLPTASAARAYGVQHCPHHDGAHGPSAWATDGQSDHAGHTTEATSAVEAAAPGEPGNHDACTCVGPCQACGSSVAALPVSPAVDPGARATSHAIVPSQTGDVLPGTPAHTLPFATAPPSSF